MNRAAGVRVLFSRITWATHIALTSSPSRLPVPSKKTNQPTHVIVKAADSGLRRDSMVLCENPERMSKERLGQYLTTLSEEYMKQVAEANLLATGAIAYLDIEALLAVWKKAAALNAVVPA